jgi:hypothetical protein
LEEADPDFYQFLMRGIEEMNYGKELHKQLIAGAENELTGKRLKPALSLKSVAEFLAWLSRTENTSLPGVVRVGLKSLGVIRPLKKRGRPKGRKADLLYVARVEETMSRIKSDGVFSRREAMKQKYGPNWRVRFMNSLKREEWTVEEIYFLTNSRGPRVFAIHIAARDCNVSYDAVDRACQRVAKAAKK